MVVAKQYILDHGVRGVLNDILGFYMPGRLALIHGCVEYQGS
jgi:hypothetical protein